MHWINFTIIRELHEYSEGRRYSNLYRYSTGTTASTIINNEVYREYWSGYGQALSITVEGTVECRTTTSSLAACPIVVRTGTSGTSGRQTVKYYYQVLGVVNMVRIRYGSITGSSSTHQQLRIVFRYSYLQLLRIILFLVVAPELVLLFRSNSCFSTDGTDDMKVCGINDG